MLRQIDVLFHFYLYFFGLKRVAFLFGLHCRTEIWTPRRSCQNFGFARTAFSLRSRLGTTKTHHLCTLPVDNTYINSTITMSDHVLDQESIVCLTGEPRKLNASVSAESFRASSDSIATHIHFAVKNRPFTVTIGSNGKTENASLNNLRWVATVVRFDPDASSHNQAAAFQETEDVIHVLHDNGYNALNSLETIIHPHAKPTLKQTSNRSSSHVTLEVRLQAR